jgi:nucleoside-diphosphate-sugar epimerase
MLVACWDLGVDDKRVGVLGATSFVGECLLQQLTGAGWRATAFSRRVVKQSFENVDWRQIPSLSDATFPQTERNIRHWICVAPIWALSDCFRLLEEHGVRRVVALSSTSRFTKDDSSNPQEQTIARRLVDAEERLQAWAESKGVEWVILRPTLIYGSARDKNISEIARFIRRFRFFPLFGLAHGLRQPVHAEDVAGACFSVLKASDVANRAYNISGAETLSYREMASRIFAALGRPPRLLTVPLGVFRLAVACLRWLPRYRHWSVAMAERMNRDLVFDHIDATRDFGFHPRAFVLSIEDVS